MIKYDPDACRGLIGSDSLTIKGTIIFKHSSDWEINFFSYTFRFSIIKLSCLDCSSECLSFIYRILPVNRRIPLPHFDEVFIDGCLRPFKDSSDFGITQSRHSAFKRNSHIIGQI